ncbi:hypothetical protein D9M68_719690 [compost metagenome]
MTTSKLSVEQQETARKTLQVLLQAIANTTLSPVAVAIGVDESTVSRMRSDRFPQFAEILTVLNLKLVPADAKLYDEEDIRALIHLSRRQLAAVTPDTLAKGGTS